MKKLRIGISGSYGGLNLGDEAILQTIISLLRSHLGNLEITVFSKNPEDTLKRHNVERAVPVRKMNRNEVLPEVQRLDFFILGGGGILFDGEARIFLREVMLAKEASVPVIVYAISVGPLRDPMEQGIVREWLNRVDLLIVRERLAQRMLEDIGVTKEIIVSADSALLLEPEEVDEAVLKREDIYGKKLIGISVREPGPAMQVDLQKYYAYVANATDYMVERFEAEAVFIPMERQVLDLQHSHKVISQMLNAQKALVLKGEYSPGQILTIAKSFTFGVGMRLHFLIFMAIANVPFAALPYASKVEGLLEDLKLELPPSHLNPGRLIAYIDRIWDYREEFNARIVERLELLKHKALETNKLVVRFIRDTLKKKETEGK
jgi:polysaccharide pyruvyl transferase CsaB